MLQKIIFFAAVIADQITKAAFADRDFFFLGMRFHPMQNRGLAFNVDLGVPVNLFFSILVYVVGSWLVLRVNSPGNQMKIGQALFLAGAASNLADRLILGHVRDFIDLGLGFVFNLADVSIVIGIILLFIGSGKKKKVENI
jgi:signal peptidase II